MKKFPVSFSRMSCFENCPQQFDYLYVSKVVKDLGNTHTEYGTRVHEALEKIAKVGTDPIERAKLELEGIPLEVREHVRLVDRLLAKPGQKFFEHQMTIDSNRQPCGWFGDDVWVRSIADVLIVDGTTAYVIDWKGLPLDTKLPTPTGFTTMGAVKVGDTLFSESGEQCAVTGKSAVKNLRCFRISFNDTSTVVCDEEHLWKLHTGEVRCVTAMAPGDRVLVAAPLALPDAQLPIDPYVLGLWLADGKHTSAEITKPDDFVWDEVQRRGYAVGHDYSAKANDGKCRVHTVKGLRTQLRLAGLLGAKHIPLAYLRAGYTQRLDLLRGLMDGDGNVNAARKQCVFTTTDPALSAQVSELLCSLGQRPLISEVKYAGFGVTGFAYPVSFKPLGINPFLLPRKADRVLPAWGRGASWYRRVVSVEEVPPVPTQCISVDSLDRTFLCTEKMIPTHNTGKPKDNPTQMQLFACMAMIHFPEVQEVKTSFVWLNHNHVTNAAYPRSMFDLLWSGIERRLNNLQETVDLGVFKAKPSGLCKWCAAKKVCAYAK